KREAPLETRSRMRSVADHHVDRPGMQARQRVQSTGTNPPIGLIRSGEGGSMSGDRAHRQEPAPISRPALGGGAVQRGKTVSSEVPAATRRPPPSPDLASPRKAPVRRRLARSGGHSARETPGPIPNPAVKPRRADGT